MSISSAHLASLPFNNTRSFSRAVLEPSVLLDLLREAEAHELALFQSDRPGPNAFVAEQLERLRLGRSINGKWDVPMARAPLRRSMPDQPTPLKKRAVDTEDPERYLIAASRLLEVYHLPRAKDHVNRLLSDYESLVDSIADLEQELGTSSGNPSSAAIEQAIKREELETLALRDANIQLERRLKAHARTKKKSHIHDLMREPPQSPVAVSFDAALDHPAPPLQDEAAIFQPVDVPFGSSSQTTPVSPPKSLLAEGKIKAAASPVSLVSDSVSPASDSVPPVQALASPSDTNFIAAMCWSKMGQVLQSLVSESPSRASPTADSLLPILARLADDGAVPAKDRAECQLAHILMEAYRLPAEAPPVRGQLVDPATRTGAVPMFPMSALKESLSVWAKAAVGIDRETAMQLPTKAIYALVAKSLLRIDRRSKDALVYFSPAE